MQVQNGEGEVWVSENVDYSGLVKIPTVLPSKQEYFSVFSAFSCPFLPQKFCQFQESSSDLSLLFIIIVRSILFLVQSKRKAVGPFISFRVVL